MCVNNSYHPDDELIDVVWVAKLVDQRKQHTTRKHLLKKTSQSIFSNNLHYKRAVTWSVTAVSSVQVVGK